MNRNQKIKIVLLLASSMTVMAGAILAPALTEMAGFFSTSSDIVIKLIITMPALMIAIFGTVIGSLSDRWGRKNILIMSLVLYGAGGFSGYFFESIEWLLISRAVLGIGVAGIMGIATTLIGDYFDGPERSSFVGAQSAFMSVGGVVFLLAGGFLADINWRFPFIIYLSAFLLLPFVIAVLYEPARERSPGTANSPLPVIEGQTLRITALVYILGFLGMVFFYMIPTQIPFLLKERMDVSQTLHGLAIAVTTMTSALAALRYGVVKRQLHFSTIFVVSFVLMAAGYFCVALFQRCAGILTGLAIAGLGLGLLLPNSNLWLMNTADPNHRGKIIGGLSSAFFLGQFVSPLATGVVTYYHDLTFAFYVAAAAMVCLSVIVLISRRYV